MINKVIILLIISICIRIRIYICINIVRIIIIISINIGIGGMMLPIVHAHTHKLFLIIIAGICTCHVVDIVTVMRMKLCMRVISFVADSDIGWRVPMSRDGCVEILSIFLILCVVYVDSCV